MRSFAAVKRSAAPGARTALLACAGTLLLVSACGSALPRTASAAGAAPGNKNASSSPAGRSYAPPVRCGEAEQPVGYLGVVRPGEAAWARNALGTALLTEVSDAGLGVVDIAVTANGMSAAERQRDFSSWGPVLPQARQAWLQSCDMLLSDRPADQPLISAALAAVAKHGYAISAARLRSVLLEVLVSDNPAAANGSVVVTLQANGGPAYEQVAKGAPPVHSYLVYTVLENASNARVTGVAAGGFGAEVPLMVKCRIGPAPPGSVVGPAAAAIGAVRECR